MKPLVQMRWNVRVPLRDGVHLSGILYLPAATPKPHPVILAMTPYVAQGLHDQGIYFAEQGFAFLGVDVRGRGNSQGEFHPLNEAEDGYDIVQWLAAQPYCNGKVGMWGGSYLGYCQWAVSKLKPLNLATMVPVAAPCRGVDSPVRNNVFTPYSLLWLAAVWGRAAQNRICQDPAFWTERYRQAFESGVPFCQLDSFLGNPSPLFQEWVSHPHRDAYWDRHNPNDEQYARLDIPILTITGAYDGDQPGALAHYRQHVSHASPEARSRHYLVIGPWDHAGTGLPKLKFSGVEVGPESLVDMRTLHRQWYAWTMQDGPRPELLKRNVSYYVTGAERWRHAETLEAVTAAFAPYYLCSNGHAEDVFHSGTLTDEPAQISEPDTYVYDPRNTSLAGLESTVDIESLTDQRMLHAARGKRLIYHSAPFERDVEVSGFFRLVLWLAIDQPDTDFRATVHEIALDGNSLLLSVDWLRARYRESFREERLIDTKEPLRYELANFTFVSRQIRQGHRLRLEVGPIDSIYWQKNYNSGGIVCEESFAQARVVTVGLFHDQARCSVLHVPLGATTE